MYRKENNFKAMISELKDFFSRQFGDDHFTIIYGSNAYKTNTSSSDLDFVTACKHFHDSHLQEVLKFAFDLYERYGLMIDDEVPHEKKILISYETVNRAINGHGFERKVDSIHVPPVVKTPGFLSSDEIVMRLSLNALTGKSVFVSGNRQYYLKMRRKALENLVKFNFLINNVNSFTVAEFTDSLIGTPERNSEMYLGYKDNPKVKKHLSKTFLTQFERLSKRQILKYTEKTGRYCLVDKKWLKEVS
ncbi:MAG: Aminotransferase, classes I and II [candidate division CPR2 bacterium GW2011_GWC1_39_9]|uniref:Aminotransferase, classes I and II n=1 Tax=candidate division CPR2 bacterium GW2011_GWC2_39_10 TaxID=1618345 RepID=A0A0G0M042_UNCC2|nr:MAG: Aminotransferase, classes I and II [candidate division CPR2 bacterium GW2011_GWC2_39_10]KKR34190.1 MAG: Aminotransferase, classes I and II [candidate division CPR2 bacterium GW2011_GWC1_39_9]